MLCEAKDFADHVHSNFLFLLKEKSLHMSFFCCCTFLILWYYSLPRDTHQQIVTCRSDHFLGRDHNKELCIPCPGGSFISEDNHRIMSCRACRSPQACHHGRASKPLRKNSVTGCRKGYYQKSPMECVKCSTCHRSRHVIRPCNKTSDVVCCPMPGMTVVTSENGTEECAFVRVVEVVG